MLLELVQSISSYLFDPPSHSQLHPVHIPPRRPRTLKPLDPTGSFYLTGTQTLVMEQTYYPPTPASASSSRHSQLRSSDPTIASPCRERSRSGRVCLHCFRLRQEMNAMKEHLRKLTLDVRSHNRGRGYDQGDHYTARTPIGKARCRRKKRVGSHSTSTSSSSTTKRILWAPKSNKLLKLTHSSSSTPGMKIAEQDTPLPLVLRSIRPGPGISFHDTVLGPPISLAYSSSSSSDEWSSSPHSTESLGVSSGTTLVSVEVDNCAEDDHIVSEERYVRALLLPMGQHS